MNNDQNVKKELERLRREVAYHAKKYYVDDAPEISDYDYDMLYRRLEELEAAHPEFFDPSSPTQRVGGTPLVRMFFRLKSLRHISTAPRHGSPRQISCPSGRWSRR